MKMMSNDERQDDDDVKFSLEDLDSILEETLPQTQPLEHFNVLSPGQGGKQVIDLANGNADKFDISKIDIPASFMESITGERVEAIPARKAIAKETKPIQNNNFVLTESQINTLQEAKKIIDSLLEMTTVGCIGTGFSAPKPQKKKSFKAMKKKPKTKRSSRLQQILNQYNHN